MTRTLRKTLSFRNTLRPWPPRCSACGRKTRRRRQKRTGFKHWFNVFCLKLFLFIQHSFIFFLELYVGPELCLCCDIRRYRECPQAVGARRPPRRLRRTRRAHVVLPCERPPPAVPSAAFLTRCALNSVFSLTTHPTTDAVSAGVRRGLSSYLLTPRTPPDGRSLRRGRDGV